MSDASIAPIRSEAVAAPVAGGGRRSDLDALRGAAMILGIVLHASLAYVPVPWPVQDIQQARWLGPVYAVIHGFRMPLFFLLSGFFTMLVFRRRGLRSLLEQRLLRIGLPLVISMVTILPLDHAVIGWATRRQSASLAARNPLAGSILAGDAADARRQMAGSPDLESRDPVTGVSPLGLAAMGGDPEILTLLLDAGAAIDATGRDGSTPLHAAGFVGQAEAVRILLDRGADPAVRNAAGKTPLDALEVSADMAVLVGAFLGLPVRTADDISRGRDGVRELLASRTPVAAPPRRIDAIASAYRMALASPRFRVDVGGLSWHLFGTEIFDHLWFLWYLCWLVGAFAIAVVVGLAPTGRLRWWLIPVTGLSQALMWSPYGPDTALGLLPTPHLLLYYGCFYWFGAGTYAAEGTDTPLGRHWRFVLPVSLLILFPAGIATIGNLPFAVVLQPAFAWGMSLGLIGLCRHSFSRPSTAGRWLSDAAYWMYLAHLPLVIGLQAILCDESWPAAAKFFTVVVITVVILLLTYRWCVRYTPIGWLLNGRRTAASSVATL